MANPYFPSFFGRGEDPFRSIFQEVQKTCEEFTRRAPFGRFGFDRLSPKVDVAETKDGVQVTAELPGVDEDDLEVALEEDTLTIRGEKKTERKEDDKDTNWHMVERSYGAFRRTIQLPFDADAATVDAKFDKGVLRITVPKPADAAKKKQKINISKDQSPGSERPTPPTSS